VHTQRYGRRPYGVGFLIAGYDVCIVALLLTTTWLLCHSRCTPLLPQKTGPHIFETCPSGNFFEYKAMAIGARSQACKTYLERTFEEYEAGTYKCLASLPRSLAQTHSLTHSASCISATREALLKHALTALREATGSQSEGLSTKNVSLGIVGADEQFHLLTAEELEPLVR